MTLAAAILVALVGAFAGASLRPVLENYVSKRRSRLEINLPPNLVNYIELPYEMRIEWEGEIHKRFNERAFFIKNLTGRTIRDVEIFLESTLLQDIEREYSPYKYDLILDHILPNKASYKDVDGNGLSKKICIENLEPGKSVGGRIVSTFAHKPTFRTSSDFEIVVSSKEVRPGNSWKRFYSQSLSSALAIAAVATAIGGISNEGFSLLAKLLGLE